MVLKILRRPRRAGLLVSGSLLMASFYYLGTHPQSQTASSSSSPPSHASPDNANANAHAPAPKKPAAADPFQKPILNLELPVLSYGTNARPPLKDLSVVVADLPAEYVPSLDPHASGTFSWRGSKPAPRRLVIIGDVHGQLGSLQELLAKVGFDREKGDHLILAGDMVNKGPDSAGVVQLAMDLGASAVRGNHDDKLLLVHKAMQKPDAASASAPKGKEGASKVHTYEGSDGSGGLLAGWFGMGGKKDTFTVTELEDTEKSREATKWKGENGEPNLEAQAAEEKKTKPQIGQVPRYASRGDEEFRKLVTSMSDEQLAWLSTLPVILRIGHIPSGDAAAESVSSSRAPWNGELVVAHAGIVPFLPLEKQDPWAVTHMRSIKFPAEGMRRAEVKKYLQKVLKQKNRGRAVPVRPDEIDKELRRLHDELPPETWEHDRDVAVPDEGLEGESWSDIWNEVQNNRVAEEIDRMVVIYGHDAKAGLNVDLEVQVEDKRPESAEEKKQREAEEKARKSWLSWGSKKEEPAKKTRAGTRYAFGLDSGCVYGKQLTALILEAGLENEKGIVHQVVQVNCPEAVPAADRTKGGKGKGRK